MKILPKLFTTLIFLLLSASVIKADYSASYKSYLSLSDYYRTVSQSYQIAKNKYLTYRTMTAKNEALINGRNFLKTRDQLVLQYLQLLKDRIYESGGYDGQQKDLLLGQLNVESSWLETHRQIYDGVSTLEDLQRTSDQMQDRYLSSVRYIALQSAGAILVNKAQITTNSINSIIIRLEEQLNLISIEGADLTVAQRWLLEAKNKVNSASDKQLEAKTIFDKLHGENLSADYGQGIYLLTESNQYLKEANSYLFEIIRIIKGG